MPAGVKYGHQRPKKGDSSQAGLWINLSLATIWLIFAFVWGAGRLAALFDYHPALGAPALDYSGTPLYWPWKVFVWQYQYGDKYLSVKEIVDQTYLAAFGLPLLCGLIYLAAQSGLKGRADLHGSAKWATRKDIDSMGYLRGTGVYIGGYYDQKTKEHLYLRQDGPEHIMVFAPTRSGKGVGLILPTLLTGEYAGGEYSTVVLDIKGENYALTAGQMASRGHKVLRVDLADMEGTSAAFNPFGELNLDSPKLIPNTQEISSIMMDPDGKGLKDYWAEAGFDFLTGALLHCLIKMKAEQGRAATLYDLTLLLQDPDRPIQQLFEEMLAMKHQEILKEAFPDLQEYLAEAAHVHVASAARGMLSKAEAELSGVISTITAKLSLYKDPVVALNTSRNDFYLSDLMNYEVPVNLYLVVSPRDRDRLKPFLRIFVSQIMNRFTEKMEFANGASVASYKHRLLLLLDEFPSLGKLAAVEQAISFMGGYGVKGYFIIQDTPQLFKHYGKDNELFSNCHIKIAFAPNLLETAEMLSKMVGSTTVVDKKVSISSGRGGSSRTTNISETARPLLTPDECLRLPGITKGKDGKVSSSGDMLILTAGNPPIYGRQILYFLDQKFQKWAKKKVPGVEEGWSRGLSHSLHHPMPIIGTKPSTISEVPAISEQNAVVLEDLPDDLAEVYSTYLASAGG